MTRPGYKSDAVPLMIPKKPNLKAPTRYERIQVASAKRFGKSVTTLREEADRDAQSVRAFCAWCPWTLAGRFDEVRILALEHRTECHGWKPKRRRKKVAA